MTLTEFLLARITEDEAVAMEAVREGAEEPADRIALLTARFGNIDLTVHPDWLLAECEAKRRIIDKFTWDDLGDEVSDPMGVLALFAQVYADHPEYPLNAENRPHQPG